MKKLLQQLFGKIRNQATKQVERVCVRTNEMLLRDLKNCYTQNDLERFIDVFSYCKSDLTVLQCAELGNEIFYRRKLIQWIDDNMTQEYYSVAEIYSLLQKQNSYAVCDAIEIYINKNKSKYLNDYTITGYNKPLVYTKLSSLDIFSRMIAKRKSFIYENYLSGL